jgi:hypothetical protein
MTLRPPEEDDFAQMLELMNAHQLAAFGEADLTEDELRTWLTSPSVRDRARHPGTRARRPARRLRRRRSTRADPPLWWCDVKRRPDVDADAIAPSSSAGSSDASTPDGCACGRRRRTRGSSPRSSGSASRRSALLPDGDRPRGRAGGACLAGGISVRTLADGEERPIYDAFMEVWQDTSDPPDDTFEEWATG